MRDSYMQKIRASVKSFKGMSDEKLEDLQAYSSLTEKEFTCFVLNSSGVKGSEIAELLDVKRTTVYNKKRRAKDKIERAKNDVEIENLVSD